MGNVLENNNLSKGIQEGIEKYEYLYLLKKLKLQSQKLFTIV